MAALGAAYLDLGDMEKAAAWIELAQRLAPRNGETNANLAILRAVEGDSSAAAEYGARVLEYELPEFAGYAMAPIRDHLIRQGRLDEARALYVRTFPQLFSPQVTVEPVNWWPALDLAIVLTRTGEKAQAKRLLGRLLERIGRATRLTAFWGYGIIDVHVYELLGERDQALARLEQAVDAGWITFWPYELKADLNLASMHELPRFRSVVARIEADMAAQLALLREWEAKGELSPVPAELQALSGKLE